MATRKNRKSRGRKSRGRKMRGGNGNGNGVVSGTLNTTAANAASAASAPAGVNASEIHSRVAPLSANGLKSVESDSPALNANALSKKLKGLQETQPEEEGGEGAQPVGGKRKTRKRRISRGASKWNQFVMRTFKEMRKKNKDVKLMDAMKECSKQKKKGMKY